MVCAVVIVRWLLSLLVLLSVVVTMIVVVCCCGGGGGGGGMLLLALLWWPDKNCEHGDFGLGDFFIFPMQLQAVNRLQGSSNHAGCNFLCAT